MEQFASQLEQWHLSLPGLAVAGVILIFFAIGWKRGMVKEIISCLYIFLVMGLVWFLHPYVQTVIEERTPVYAAVEEKCREAVESASGNYALLLNNGGSTVQEKAIQSLGLPNIIEKELVNNNNKQGYLELGAENFIDFLQKFLTNKIFSAITFVATWLLASLLVALLTAVLNAVASLPVLKEANKLGGGILGAAKSLVVIWLAMVILTLLAGTSTGEGFMEILTKDAFLSFLYEKNPLMYFIMTLS